MMTLHSIHLLKLPPIENVDPPSNRRAMPARSRQISAITGKSWMRSRTMSSKICGVGIGSSEKSPGLRLARAFSGTEGPQNPSTRRLRLPAGSKTRSNGLSRISPATWLKPAATAQKFGPR